jgi:cell division septation protein DedD
VAPARDDGFHEIQLNGKQLVFLFMAATVVSVVIFLCGVLVGRGVRVERGLMADASASTAVVETSPPAQAPPAASAPAGSDPRAAPPPPPVDDLSYFNRLETKTAPREQLKPTPEKTAAADKPTEAVKAPPARAERAAPPPAREAPPPPAAPAATPPPAASPAAPPELAAEPAGAGFAVQIAALNVRDEAEAIAKRLSSKGYAAYVLTPTDGPAVYRVRVGKFQTRREAESIAARLKKEEQFNPWVTR